MTATGTLATATFTVKAGAAEGAVADITVTFNENNQCDADMNNVPMTVNNGSVTVAKAEEPTTAAPATTTAAPTEPTKTPVTDAPTTTAAPATTGTGASPDTGSALPIAAIVLAAGSAAVLTFARKK